MRKLYRSRNDCKIAGVCGGIGEMLDIDPNLIRLMVVFTCVVTAILPVAVTYIAAWIIFPEEP
jgi:phage shock protein C